MHQGSALSPLLFNLVMDYLTKDIQKPPPQNLLYADDILLISESVDDLQEDLDKWRDALENNGLRISRTKTELLVCNFASHADQPNIHLDRNPIKRVDSFKYLGSVICSTGGIDADVSHRVNAAWMKWRSLTGVMCDRRMPVQTKGKVYKTAIRPTMLYSSECWASKRTHEQKLHTAEMRMLRWSAGVTLKDKVQNRHIRGSFKVRAIEEKLVGNRLRWYGHVARRPDDHVVKKCLSIATNKRGRGRPPTTWLTRVQRDMKRLEIDDDLVNDRSSWRLRTRRADPR